MNVIVAAVHDAAATGAPDEGGERLEDLSAARREEVVSRRRYPSLNLACSTHRARYALRLTRPRSRCSACYRATSSSHVVVYHQLFLCRLPALMLLRSTMTSGRVQRARVYRWRLTSRWKMATMMQKAPMLPTRPCRGATRRKVSQCASAAPSYPHICSPKR